MAKLEDVFGTRRSLWREKQAVFIHLWLWAKPLWLIFVTSFLLGRALFMGELLPLGLSLATAFRATREKKDLGCAFLGILFGTLSLAPTASVFPYVVTLFVIWMATHKKRTERARYRFWHKLSVLSFLLIKFPLAFLSAPFAMTFVVALCEGMVSGICFGVLKKLLERTKARHLAHKEMSLLFFLLSLLLGANFTVLTFPFRLGLVFYLSLLAVVVGGVPIAIMAGATLGLFMVLMEGSAVPLGLILSAPIFAGLLHPMTLGLELGVLFAFVLSIPEPIQAAHIPYLLLLMGAVALVRLTPPRLLRRVTRILPGTRLYRQRQLAHQEKVKELLGKKVQEHAKVFSEMSEALEGSREQFLPQQLASLAKMVKDLGKEFAPEHVFSEMVEEKLLEAIQFYEHCAVTVVDSKDGCEIYGSAPHPCTKERRCQELLLQCQRELRRPYAITERSCQKNDLAPCSFTIKPLPRYSLEVYTAKLARDGISGDSGGLIPLSVGKKAILLSDGMGVGAKAHEESSTTVRLLESLFRAGYSLELAISLINNLLLIRSQEERFATIDLAFVDLFHGHLEFIKIGAAPSFIKRGQEVDVIHNRSLPVGILQHIDVEADRRLLREGEYLIMVTDGILEAQKQVVHKELWMSRILRRVEDPLDAQTLAESLLEYSLELSGGEVVDDMMISVARLLRNDQEIDSYRGDDYRWKR